MIKTNLNRYKNSIKIWPYLDDLSQAIIPYSDEHLSKNKNTAVNLDFSCIRRISSAGASITLFKLISLLVNKGYIFRIIMPENRSVENYLQDSGFLSLLDKTLNINKVDLFDSISINNHAKPYITSNKGVKKTSFPIYYLKHDKDDRRKSVEEFADWITDILYDNLSDYNIKKNVLAAVLTEIAKNTQDHTEGDACFGIDIIECTQTKSGEIIFSCSDLGVGISSNIRNHIKENPSNLRESAYKHFSYTDSYKYAFTVGNTTSKDSKNKGIGMSMILDGVNLLNIDLTIWDGRSMLLVPDLITHSELRRKAFNTSLAVGFYYYGRLNF